MILLLNSEVECTHGIINIFEGLQVLFLGFNSDFAIARSFFCAVHLLHTCPTTNLASQVASITAASIRNTSQLLKWSLSSRSVSNEGPFVACVVLQFNKPTLEMSYGVTCATQRAKLSILPGCRFIQVFLNFFSLGDPGA